MNTIFESIHFLYKQWLINCLLKQIFYLPWQSQHSWQSSQKKNFALKNWGGRLWVFFNISLTASLFILTNQIWHYHNLTHMVRNYFFEVTTNQVTLLNVRYSKMQRKTLSAISSKLVRIFFFFANWSKDALKHCK